MATTQGLRHCCYHYCHCNLGKQRDFDIVVIRAVESVFKSNPIFSIFSDFSISSDFLSDFIRFLSDFFRFLDFSRLSDLPIPQL